MTRLSLTERTRVLEILDSEEYVDQPPLQVFVTAFEAGRGIRPDTRRLLRRLPDGGSPVRRGLAFARNQRR